MFFVDGIKSLAIDFYRKPNYPPLMLSSVMVPTMDSEMDIIFNDQCLIHIALHIILVIIKENGNNDKNCCCYCFTA